MCAGGHVSRPLLITSSHYSPHRRAEASTPWCLIKLPLLVFHWCVLRDPPTQWCSSVAWQHGRTCSGLGSLRKVSTREQLALRDSARSHYASLIILRCELICHLLNPALNCSLALDKHELLQKRQLFFLKAMCLLGLFVTLCLFSLCDNPQGSINDELVQPLMLQNPFVDK